MKRFQLPESKIRFFVRLSGFLKTTFLKPTHIREFPGAKIFPDKKCPASGFCLNRLRIAFSSGNILAYLMPNFKVPDKTIRFFVGLSGFLKTTFLTPTHIREFLGAKIFPDKKSPVSSFCLNRIHAAFSSWG